MKTIIALTLVLLSSISMANGFEEGFCSMYTEEGEWSVSYGRQAPAFHCNLLQHELIGSSPIADTFSGWFDAYDMNHITVVCDGEGNSFELDDFGGYGIDKAIRRAQRLEATHCLFEIEPHFQ